MTIKRAYSFLQVKGADDEQRVIKGIATTPEVDRMGDIIDPMGAQFKNPTPLLWMHDPSLPVGTVTFGKATKAGIPFTARFPKIDNPAGLAARIEEAWQSVKNGLVAAVSIGFNPTVSPKGLPTGGLMFPEVEILELSLVTIPANAGATITEVKSIDRKALAASGKKSSTVEPKTAVADKSIKTKGKTTMTIKEQIAKFEQEREDLATQMKNFMSDGETVSDENDAEYNTLEKNLANVDKHLKRLKTLAKVEASEALTEEAGTTTKGANGFRAQAPTIIKARDTHEDKFKGQSFTRMVIAKALAHNIGGGIRASEVAFQRWGRTNPRLIEFIKANEVSGAGTTSGSGLWGSELVSVNDAFTGDFIEYLYSRTVFDRLGCRAIPANVTIKGQDGAATGYWIEEGKAIKMSKGDFSEVTLTPSKAAAITTVSNELLRDSTPSAEALIRDALIEAIAQEIDAKFLGTQAASGAVPAGMLNGPSPGTSAGNDGDGVRADVKALYASFLSAKNASGLKFIMNPATAKALQLMTNTLGGAEFPTINQDGGTLLGDAVVTSENVNASHLILAKPSDIYMIGDLGINVEISREATIEHASDPTGVGVANPPVAASKQPVSMFQNDMTAIRVIRPLNFKKRRSGAVAYINDVAYGEPES